MSDLWKQLRAKNVGGSEIAALFGESPYTTMYKLWHEKKGFILPEDLDADERVQAGNFLEAGAIAWANKKWGMNLYRPMVYVEHPSVEGMACTPDAFDHSNTGAMAQVKNVDSLRFALKWEAEGDTITEAPLEILLQVQHEMECARKDESWLIALVGGNRLYRMHCRRDEEIGSVLRRAVMEFWLRTDPPPPEFDRDGETIAELRAKLPQREELDLTGDEYVYDLARRGLAATVARNRAQDDLDCINAEILHLIGNAANVRCGDMLLKFYTGRKTPKYISEGATL